MARREGCGNALVKNAGHRDIYIECGRHFLCDKEYAWNKPGCMSQKTYKPLGCEKKTTSPGAERTDFAKKTNIRLPARAGSESENAQEWQTRKVKILQMKPCEILS